MKASIALGLALVGLGGLVVPASGQEGFPTLPPLPSPLTVAPLPPAPPLHELPSPSAAAPDTIAVRGIENTNVEEAEPRAPAEVWNSDASCRDRHFYANVGLNYLWVHGGNPSASGPVTGASFSAGVQNDRGLGVGVTGMELFQSTTREVQHKP